MFLRRPTVQKLGHTLLANSTLATAQRALSTQSPLASLEIRVKFNQNRNVPNLFKNSHTDDYVSLSSLKSLILI